MTFAERTAVGALGLNPPRGLTGATVTSISSGSAKPLPLKSPSHGKSAEPTDELGLLKPTVPLLSCPTDVPTLPRSSVRPDASRA